MIKKILYATDFSEAAENALPHSITLSLLFGSKLIFFNAQILLQDDPSNPLYHFPEKEEILKKADEIAKELLNKKAKEVKEIEIETITSRDIFPDRAILSVSEEKNVDLIVMGTHGRRGIVKFLIGSTTLNVLKFSKTPVYVVPPDIKAPSKECPYRQLLVCMDFSKSSIEALKIANYFKEKTNGKIHIIYVEEKETSMKKLKEIEKKYSLDKIKILKGKPEKEILKYAREEAIDLIFLGKRKEEELFAIGSKVERIILNSPSPCIVSGI